MKRTSIVLKFIHTATLLTASAAPQLLGQTTPAPSAGSAIAEIISRLSHTSDETPPTLSQAPLPTPQPTPIKLPDAYIAMLDRNTPDNAAVKIDVDVYTSPFSIFLNEDHIDFDTRKYVPNWHYLNNDSVEINTRQDLDPDNQIRIFQLWEDLPFKTIDLTEKIYRNKQGIHITTVESQTDNAAYHPSAGASSADLTKTASRVKKQADDDEDLDFLAEANRRASEWAKLNCDDGGNPAECTPDDKASLPTPVEPEAAAPAADDNNDKRGIIFDRDANWLANDDPDLNEIINYSSGVQRPADDARPFDGGPAPAPYTVMLVNKERQFDKNNFLTDVKILWTAFGGKGDLRASSDLSEKYTAGYLAESTFHSHAKSSAISDDKTSTSTTYTISKTEKFDKGVLLESRKALETETTGENQQSSDYTTRGIDRDPKNGTYTIKTLDHQTVNGHLLWRIEKTFVSKDSEGTEITRGNGTQTGADGWPSPIHYDTKKKDWFPDDNNPPVGIQQSTNEQSVSSRPVAFVAIKGLSRAFFVNQAFNNQ